MQQKFDDILYQGGVTISTYGHNCLILIQRLSSSRSYSLWIFEQSVLWRINEVGLYDN